MCKNKYLLSVGICKSFKWHLFLPVHHLCTFKNSQLWFRHGFHTILIRNSDYSIHSLNSLNFTIKKVKISRTCRVTWCSQVTRSCYQSPRCLSAVLIMWFCPLQTLQSAVTELRIAEKFSTITESAWRNKVTALKYVIRKVAPFGAQNGASVWIKFKLPHIPV